VLRQDKLIVSNRVVDQVKALDPPGCFVKQEANGPFKLAAAGDIFSNVFLAHIDLLDESTH
jgi:hypothetical protein